MVKHKFLAEHAKTNRNQHEQIGWIVGVNDVETLGEKTPTASNRNLRTSTSRIPTGIPKSVTRWRSKKTVNVHTFDVFVAGQCPFAGRNHCDLESGIDQRLASRRTRRSLGYGLFSNSINTRHFFWMSLFVFFGIDMISCNGNVLLKSVVNDFGNLGVTQGWTTNRCPVIAIALFADLFAVAHQVDDDLILYGLPVAISRKAELPLVTTKTSDSSMTSFIVFRIKEAICGSSRSRNARLDPIN